MPVGFEPGDLVLVLLIPSIALVTARFSGRAAWIVGAVYAVFLVVMYATSGDKGPGLLVLTLPGFLAGTVLRLRRENAEELRERAAELAREQELFSELSVRNERARIASELHDIVGHALSVMVVQAAAGQRLVDRAPDDAAPALAAIASSARQGQADLRRLIDLLSGTDVPAHDLSVVEQVVQHASRSGLQVSCEVEGPRATVSPERAQTVFRIVQEGLTNALRHAPGAEVSVRVRIEERGELRVRVDNGPPTSTQPTGFVGNGRGLSGLRERVHALGGTFSAGQRGDGWRLEARLTW